MGIDRRGEKNGRAELTAKKVDRIRMNLLNGATQTSQAKKYRKNPSTIHRILTGGLWNGIGVIKI